MKTQKVTLKIEVNCLDIASARGLLLQMIDNIEREAESGALYMGDGDKVDWNTSKKEVKI